MKIDGYGYTANWQDIIRWYTAEHLPTKFILRYICMHVYAWLGSVEEKIAEDGE